MSVARIQDFDDPAYDPFTSDAVMFGEHADPYPQIAAWRAEAPLIPGSWRSLMRIGEIEPPPGDAFVVVGAAEIYEVLTDASRFTNCAYATTIGATFGQGSLSVLDGAEHAR
jgi:cytochrome P450